MYVLLADLNIKQITANLVRLGKGRTLTNPHVIIRSDYCTSNLTSMFGNSFIGTEPQKFPTNVFDFWYTENSKFGTFSGICL